MTTTATAATGSHERKKQTDTSEMTCEKHVDTHERVQALVDQLKGKHNTKYTPMRYLLHMGKADYWGSAC